MSLGSSFDSSLLCGRADYHPRAPLSSRCLPVPALAGTWRTWKVATDWLPEENTVPPCADLAAPKSLSCSVRPREGRRGTLHPRREQGGCVLPPPCPREGDSGGGCPRHVLGGRPKVKTPKCPPAVGGPRPARGRPSQIPEIHPPRSRVEAGAQPSPSRGAGGGSRGRAVGRRPSRPVPSGILGGCRRTCAAACGLVLRKSHPNSAQRTLLPPRGRR